MIIPRVRYKAAQSGWGRQMVVLSALLLHHHGFINNYYLKRRTYISTGVDGVDKLGCYGNLELDGNFPAFFPKKRVFTLLVLSELMYCLEFVLFKILHKFLSFSLCSLKPNISR